ncbi:MAG: AMP-binding protein, partial [Firmicutes bacterium]|nr:AMP-binding protein [Bacillota bacterium]
MTESNHGDIFSDDHVKPFLPSDQFRHKSQLSDESLYGEARDDRLAFWENMAENLSWINKWDKILDDSNPPYFKWFINGKLNVSANCIDRHVENGLGDKKALVFEGEQGDTVQFTYKELLNEVSKFSNVLQELGVSKGDAVTIWMPMVPEAIIAMLACTRIGAMHSVVFGGFSPEALKDRILDSKSKVLVTADGAFRRGKIIPMLGAAEEELEQCPSIKKVVIIERTGTSYNKKENRDFLYNDLMSKASE